MCKGDEIGRSTAAQMVLGLAEATNGSLGHENLGFLSAEHGFMPSALPRERLPPLFEPWDFAAAALPELHSSLGLRRALDQLPVISAEVEHLPDAALLRAAHVLAMLAHAYYYVETTSPGALPEAITKPWAQVRDRLGRPGVVLSYVDLIVYNFRLIDPGAPDPFQVENMRLLTPTVDTPEERVFYLTQTEILARATPIVSAVVRAQQAVVADDPGALASELGVVLSSLETMRRSLRKIEPRAGAPTHVNPVVWAKTVAPFAVPMVPNVQGPSGTSSPVFNLLDVFLGRAQHQTFLGREIRELRQGYPRFWREFLAAVGQISVPAYVAARNEPETTRLLAALRDAYAGSEGFLGRHRRKVYGYLETAFKVGRSITIGGFSGHFHDRTWNQVDAELEAARRERPPAEGEDGAPPARTPKPAASPASSPALRRSYDASELILRNGDTGDCWIAFDGHVYDLTAFLDLHPGGAHVFRLYAGMDGTHAFERAHRGAGPASALRERYCMGPLRVPNLDARAAALYRRWLLFAYLVVEMQNALHLDISLQTAVTARNEGATDRSRYKLQRAVETHERFVGSYLATCTGKLVQELWLDTETLCLGQATGFLPHALAAATSEENRGALSGAANTLKEAIAPGATDGENASPRLVETCQTLERLSEEAIAQVKSIFHRGLKAFEFHESRLLTRGRALLPSLLASLPGVIGAYHDEAILALQGLEA